MPTKLKIILFVTLSLLILDQATKIWIVNSLTYMKDEIKIIPGFLSFIHAQNPNAAFGLGNQFPQAIRLGIFFTFTAFALGILVSMYRQLEDNDKAQSTTIALILSGAFGNLIDRVHKKTVTDFIKVYAEQPELKRWLIENFRTNEWPTFNVADVCIVVGVSLYVVHYAFFEKDKEIEVNPKDNPLLRDEDKLDKKPDEKKPGDLSGFTDQELPDEVTELYKEDGAPAADGELLDDATSTNVRKLK